MTAPMPSAVPRALPGSSNTFNKHLDDGHSTKIVFTRDDNADISFWEKTVGVPGIDGGDAIEITTMHNTDWRTLAPRKLLTLTEFTVTAAYDPALISDGDNPEVQILDLINQRDTITIFFPDGSTLAFFGFLKSIEFDQLEDGTFPMCTLTIVPTNQDPVADVEEAPVMTPVVGT